MNSTSELVREVKESWGWTGLDPVDVVSENDFGNLILVDSSGRYWRMCPEDTYCKIVARDKAEYEKLTRSTEFVMDWQITTLVEAARCKLGPLGAGQKYSLVTPSILGGQYQASNMAAVPLVELIRISGDLALQMKLASNP